MASANASNMLNLVVRHLRLPTVATLNANHNRDVAESDRELTIVELNDGTHTGLGECSALNAPTYTSEWAADAFDRLSTGTIPDPRHHPMAHAAIAMALVDLRLRSEHRSLADLMSEAPAETVPIGAVVGLGPISETLETVGRLASSASRVKLKVRSGEVLSVVRAVHEQHPELTLQIDANGGLSADDLDDLVAIADLGVEAIEQPFAVDRIDLAKKLIKRSPIPVLADEAVSTLDDARHLWHERGLTGVVIKPPRMGGIEQARELLDWCRTEGVVAVVGGMLESGLGRHSLAAFASLPGFGLVGDLSPARRWLADDPWADLSSTEDGRHIIVPTGVGVAPPPDPELLDRYTIRRSSEAKLIIDAAT